MLLHLGRRIDFTLKVDSFNIDRGVMGANTSTVVSISVCKYANKTLHIKEFVLQIFEAQKPLEIKRQSQQGIVSQCYTPK
jgi:hypothetical protein